MNVFEMVIRPMPDIESLMYDDPPLPREPCNAPPGSEERIRVYRQRVERGESVFSPLDKNDCDEP